MKGLGSESAGFEHQGAGGVVEFADVVAPVGEHDRAAEVAFSRLPPVLEKTALGGGGVVLEVQSSARRGVGEVRLGVAYAQPRERVTLRRVALAAIL